MQASQRAEEVEGEEVAKQAPRESTAKLRFQMPVLARLQAEEPQAKKRGKQPSRRCRRADRIGGWTSRSHAATHPIPEPDEADESDRMGKDRRRRYLNDRLLREMAGAMTAVDMAALFQPVPFGTAQPSAFAQITQSDAAPIWDLFRNVDEDKQNAALRVWEQRVKAQRKEASDCDAPQPSGGLAALKSWARIPKKAREALKRCNPEAVEALELPISEFLDREQEPDAVLEVDPEGAFQRMMTHGLAAFHGLRSATSLSGSMRLSRWAGTAPGGAPPISCADVVFALEANPAQGVTPGMLDAEWRRNRYGTDADSEASYVLL